MKTLKLKNYFFVGSPELRAISFHEWIANQMLHGEESRARTRFLKSIAERVKEIDDTRIELLKKFAEKQEVKVGEKGKEETKMMPVMTYLDKTGGPEGQPVEKETTDPNVGKRYKISDIDGFNKEYQEYLDETYIIDVTPANRDIIYRIKDILLKTHEEFSGRMALLYDEWCEAFENISEDKEEAKSEKKGKK